MELIPKTKHAIIRICKLVLQTERDITLDDFNIVQQIFQDHLAAGMSPSDIKGHYNIIYSDFGMFLKRSFHISLLSHKESVNNYFRKVGRSVTDEKTLYYKACKFQFDPYSIPEIPGYDDLVLLGIYHPVNNPSGVCRDHMISVSYGWRNNIDPEIISHPSNCQFITNIKNIKKGDKSSLTLDDLKKRIQVNDLSPIDKHYIRLPKTKDHRKKISETNKKYMTVTDGSRNLRILKTDPIPSGFRRGLTRKNKMVGDLGLEPRNKIF